MASIQQLEQALINADKVGDTAAATALAQALKQARAPAPKAAPDTLSDVVQSTGSGLATGTMSTAGLPGDIASGIGNVAGWFGGLFGQNEQQKQGTAGLVRKAIPIVGGMPTSAEIQGGVTRTTGYQPYVPQTEAGRFANKAASFVPGAVAIGATGGLGAIPGAMASGIAGGLASQGAGNLAATVGGEKARPYGEIAGGMIGGFAPASARRVVTPFPMPVNPTRNASVNALRGEGVNDLTAGQQSGSIPLRFFESEVGGAHVAQTTQNQGEQFTRAALTRAGIDADRATPQVINAGFDRIGNDFDQLAARNNIVPDPQLHNQVLDAAVRYADNVSPPNQAPIVTRYMTEIGNAIAANGGQIPGAVYQSLRSRLSREVREASDQYVQRALSDMNEALDNAMERSISITNPQDLGGWQNARREYRNMLVLAKASTGSGERAAEGIISPAQLQTATKGVTGWRAYSRGHTDFDELARSGVNIMSPLPQSGTAPRLAARAALGAPAAIGAVVGGKVGAGDVASTLAGLVAGGMTSAAARAFLNTAWGRRYLANQLMPRRNGGPWAAQVAAPVINTTQQNRLGPPLPAMLPAR